MARRAYPTDLTHREYACLEPHLPAPSQPGRPRVHPLREILDGIFYAIRSGCAWRLLPHESPPWQTVYHSFWRWRLDGTWERLNAALRERAGRHPHPERLPPRPRTARCRARPRGGCRARRSGRAPGGVPPPAARTIGAGT